MHNNENVATVNAECIDIDEINDSFEDKEEKDTAMPIIAISEDFKNPSSSDN